MFTLCISRMNIIVASDSRGRNLKEHISIHKSFEEVGQHSLCHLLKPGAKLCTLRDQITQKLEQANTASTHIHTHITLLAGICNFTDKIHVHDRQGRNIGTQIIYTHKESKTRSIIDQLHSMSHQFNTTTTTFSIATIPPADLQKYTNKQSLKGKLNHGTIKQHSNGELSTMQTDLENDIREVNAAICTINASYKLGTIRWDRDIEKTVTKHRGAFNKNTRKVRKFVYTHLPDGVHADDHLREKWFRVACRTIVSNIKGHQHVHQQIDEPVHVSVDMTMQEDQTLHVLVEDDQQEDRESWDYKRVSKSSKV